MADNKSPEDRSMSEILASIRRIVSDEEKARREAETSRRTHEKESGESVLTLTPDMRQGENRGESLSDALGVTVAAVAEAETIAEPDTTADAPLETTLILDGAETTPAADAQGEGDAAAPSSYELPALELGEADLAPDDVDAPEPLVLRRSSLRRETDQPSEAVTPLKMVAPARVEKAEDPAPTAPAPKVDQPAAKVAEEAPAEPLITEEAAVEAPEPDAAPKADTPVAETVVVDTPDVDIPAVDTQIGDAASETPVTLPPVVTPAPAKAKQPVAQPAKPVAAPAASIRPKAKTEQDSDADNDGLLDDEFLAEPVMTEAEVEAIVRRVVREELQGPIGQQISRKVKRMIKDEIRKALYEDDSLI